MSTQCISRVLELGSVIQYHANGGLDKWNLTCVFQP